MLPILSLPGPRVRHVGVFCATRFRSGSVSLAAVLALSACAGTSLHGYSASQIARSEAALEQVRTDYRQGDYGDVIRRVAKDGALHDAPPALRVEALKMQAFSLCLRDHAAMCEDKFREILALQPDFDLAASEQGHPQWGPVFEAARRERP